MRATSPDIKSTLTNMIKNDDAPLTPNVTANKSRRSSFDSMMDADDRHRYAPRTAN